MVPRGCRSHGCHGYPLRSTRFTRGSNVTGPFPSCSSIGDEFRENTVWEKLNQVKFLVPSRHNDQKCKMEQKISKLTKIFKMKFLKIPVPFNIYVLEIRKFWPKGYHTLDGRYMCDRFLVFTTSACICSDLLQCRKNPLYGKRWQLYILPQ